MTLFLTTRSVLMFQMADNFQKSIDYRADNGEPWLKGQKVGIIGSGEFQVSRHINVATVQTPASFLEEPPRDMPADKKAYHLKRRELVAFPLKRLTANPRRSPRILRFKLL